MLDQYYFKVLNHYKSRFKSKAQNVALFYISLLQLSIITAIFTFTVLFLDQMNQIIASKSDLWNLLGVFSIVLTFRNWFYYTGKKGILIRSKIKNTKLKESSVWTLWLMPIILLILAVLIYTRL